MGHMHNLLYESFCPFISPWQNKKASAQKEAVSLSSAAIYHNPNMTNQAFAAVSHVREHLMAVPPWQWPHAEL